MAGPTMAMRVALAVLAAPAVLHPARARAAAGPPAHLTVVVDGHPMAVWSRTARHPKGVILLLHGRTWSALPDFDLQVPFMSLGAAFKTEIDTLPASKGVITVAEKDEARWRARLGPAGAFRVGLAWSGNPIHRNDRNRSIAFARFKAVFGGLSEAEKIEFHILPNRVPEQEQAEVLSHPELTFHGEALHTFADAAALVQAMDLVISVDTSLAHLAGVLDRPAIVLLPTPCDWRWMAKREDSPWYPSLRLFRQETPGDWETVLARARQDLVKRVREARR